MLCRDADLLPTGIQWAYQLKVDGFFGLPANLRGQPSLTSRSGKDLGRYFPELLKAAAELPSDTIVAGELVMAGETSHPSFAALQDRLARGLRLSATAANLIVFDLAALAGEDFTRSNFAARWDAVGLLLSSPRPYLQPIPHTQDRAEALGWLEHGRHTLGRGRRGQEPAAALARRRASSCQGQATPDTDQLVSRRERDRLGASAAISSSATPIRRTQAFQRLQTTTAMQMKAAA